MKRILALGMLFTSTCYAQINVEHPFSAIGTVAKVVDGDTAFVTLSPKDYSSFKASATSRKQEKAFNEQYKSVKVRIAAINTPESVHSNKKLNTRAGAVASQWAKKQFNKKDVRLKCWDFGKYGRPICSVERVDDGYDWGYEAIRADHSDYIQAWGQHPYFHKRYLSASK